MCTFSLIGSRQKLEDCGSTSCPDSDSYVPSKGTGETPATSASAC